MLLAKRKTQTVFIGHGASPIWRELKDFLVDELGLRYEEFNRESAAGVANSERVLALLNQCSFAFLVMTAEDELADGLRRARENVVHELGLAQATYGLHRAIMLVEERCETLSNMDGVGHIRFPRGDILARSEEIRAVLRRERILKR